MSEVDVLAQEAEAQRLAAERAHAADAAAGREDARLADEFRS